MILTVEQATKRWCPMVRASEGSGDSAANKMASNPDENEWDFAWSRCIADDCMMWRWVEDKIKYESEDYGYCGMAGKPAFLLA